MLLQKQHGQLQHTATLLLQRCCAAELGLTVQSSKQCMLADTAPDWDAVENTEVVLCCVWVPDKVAVGWVDVGKPCLESVLANEDVIHAASVASDNPQARHVH